MNRIIHPLNNQQGSVIALALMVMVILTIVGLTSINDTVLESAIARNYAIHRQTLYLAEGAVRQAVQILNDYRINDPADDDDDDVIDELMEDDPDLPWIYNKENFDHFAEDTDFGDFRGDGGSVDYGSFVPGLMSGGNANASGFLVVFEGLGAGSSLGHDELSNVFDYSVYGRGVSPMRNDPTEAMIKVLYKMRVATEEEVDDLVGGP